MMIMLRMMMMVMMMKKDFGSVPSQVLRVSQRLSPSCHLHWAQCQKVSWGDICYEMFEMAIDEPNFGNCVTVCLQLYVLERIIKEY